VLFRADCAIAYWYYGMTCKKETLEIDSEIKGPTFTVMQNRRGSACKLYTMESCIYDYVPHAHFPSASSFSTASAISAKVSNFQLYTGSALFPK
jgi:hypothetical protein